MENEISLSPTLVSEDQEKKVRSPSLLQWAWLPGDATVSSHGDENPVFPTCVVSPFHSRNPGTRTIERDLLEALGKAKAFPQDMKLDLGKVGKLFLYYIIYFVMFCAEGFYWLGLCSLYICTSVGC